MTIEQQVLRGLKNLSDKGESTFIANVVNNYPDKDFVDVKDLNGTLYPGVRKRASLSEAKAGIIITPASGSSVIVSRIGNSDELFIEMWSDLESVIIDGGKNGGLSITPELVTQLAKLTARVDGIITAIKSGVPGASDGGAALQTTIVANLEKLTDKENFSGIENKKIKH
ncbi:hypothetical protein [Dysgonomonas sp. ZJ279]|uniref:hypothetical protein n=1 Tax=Dysgonomonas sp. ZJ279 TaxID=2709796 RepID=UPI0013EA937E|nr:hypothetical protein [Dysgonomonas sp. ZJ279]